jgi:quercetin dioxygenase-like cupin family protein
MNRLVLRFAALLFMTLSAQGADKTGPIITPIARTHTTVTGQPIVVPANPDVVVSMATFPPRTKIAEHKHLYPHLVYVMDGVLTVTNTQTGKTFEVKKGDFVAEMQDTWHYGENRGPGPVKLFVIDEVPQGTKTNIMLRNSPAP